MFQSPEAGNVSQKGTSDGNTPSLCDTNRAENKDLTANEERWKKEKIIIVNYIIVVLSLLLTWTGLILL